VPLSPDEAAARTSDLVALVDGFGAIGPRHRRGREARRRAEAWSAEIVRAIRAERVPVPEGAPAHAVAWHRESGELLDDEVAAVELLNLLRPITAIATFVTFAALALVESPRSRARLLVGGDEEAERFVHEVRRYHPFTPFLAARVRREFEWRNHLFPKGRLVLLDVYGTLHDPVLWARPDVFAPERFVGRAIGAFDLIPQGGGDPFAGHRCAGERITIEAMKTSVSFLARRLDYDVPPQDLRVPLWRIPTRPRSGMILSHVRLIPIQHVPAARTLDRTP
jgi:fatty-acid peroxygenase